MFTFKTTNEKIKSVIENAYNNKTKLRFWFGNIETGESWNDEFDTIGTIGRSTGINPIPLLIKNSRSLGGGALLDNSIVKIVNMQGTVLYQHPTFKQSTFVAANLQVYADGKIYATCKNPEQAINLADFMNGKRMCK